MITLAAMLLRSLLHVVIPSDLQFKGAWKDRSVYDDKYPEYPIRTVLNRMGPHCQAVLSCLLSEFSQCSKISHDDKKVMDDFIYDMSLLCAYGRQIGTSNDYRMFVTEISMEYIEYVGPVHLDAVHEVSVFIQSGGKGTMPSIDTLVKVICSMCAVRDNRWSMDECKYLTPSGTFDPTELERCITHDMGKEGNGGMGADVYFKISKEEVYDEHGNILPKCHWTKDEEEEEEEEKENPWESW